MRDRRMSRWGAAVAAAAIVTAAASRPDAGAAPASASPQGRLWVRLREKARVTGDAGSVPQRARFRVDVSGRVDVAAKSAFQLRLGEITLDVPLFDGRYVGDIGTAGGLCRVRVRCRGRSLTAAVRTRAGAETDTFFASSVLRSLAYDLSRTTETFHGLLPAGVLLDERQIPLVAGVAGRIDSRWSGDGSDDRAIVSLTAAAIVPTDHATAPVVLMTPRRPNDGWTGRVSGFAFGTGAPPLVRYDTSFGGSRTLAMRGDTGFDVGDAQTQGPGVSVLVLPEGAVFQVPFDAAVQAPPGPQTVTLTALGRRGAAAKRSLAFEAPAADPPSQIDSDFHVLEIRGGGALWSWGYNVAGEIGDGTFASPVSPVPLSMPAPIVSVGAGDMFSIAADATGAVWAWGDIGDVSQPRPGLFVDRYVPAPRIVEGLGDIEKVSAGYEDALALDTAGGVWMWSYDLPHVRRIPGIPSMRDVAEGDDARIALDVAGDVWDLLAQDARGRSAPAKLAGLPPVRAIAAGTTALCLDLGGGVWVSSGASDLSPRRVTLPGPATAVSTGGLDGYSLALLEDGTVWSWSASGEAAITAVRLPDLEGVTLIEASSGDMSFAADRDGALWMWDSYDAEAGTERPVLAPRAYVPGHLPPDTATLAKRPARGGRHRRGR